MAIRFVTTQAETKQKVLDFIEEWNSESEEIVVKTSGSTGQPKEIRLRKEHMVASAKATGEYLGLTIGKSALLCLSMDTIGGRMMVVRSIVLGLDLIVTDVSSTPLSLVDMNIDFAAMVPLQVQRTLDDSPAKFDMVKQLIIGGGPVSSELAERLPSLTTHAFHTFGMTETISHIAMRRLNHPLEDHFSCLPNVAINENQGSLVITAPKIGVDRLKTNDVIEQLSETTFRWLGRTDFVINSGGIKLHPEQIEVKLTKCIEHPFFVYGDADTVLGERLILMIESPKDLKYSKNDFAPYLTKHAVPKEVRYVHQFVYTQSGKINRLESKNMADVAREVL